MQPVLLVVEHDEDTRNHMRWTLGEHYGLALASQREEALQLAREHRPSVMLLNLALPPPSDDLSEGFVTLAECLRLLPRLKVIVMVNEHEKEPALRAIQAGATDFINKPVDVDALRILLKRDFYLAHLEEEVEELQAQAGGRGFEGMLGDSARMQDIYAEIRRVATVSTPVMLLGESGTGKKLAARAIHQLSERRHGPFAVVSCRVGADIQLEDELFGHERGAFNGAGTYKAGRIELTTGGTLLLDEVEALPDVLQLKLLTYLRDGRMERMGGLIPVVADTRIIGASHVDLPALVHEGLFREDLFYRLATVTIHMPPLHERGSDAVLLARAFLHQYATEAGRPTLHFSSKSIQAIACHDWPGNIPELQNRVRRAVIMAATNLIKPSDLQLASGADVYAGATLKEAREQLERDYVRRALARANGNMTRAASFLEVSRPTLYEMMNKLGITRRRRMERP